MDSFSAQEVAGILYAGKWTALFTISSIGETWCIESSRSLSFLINHDPLEFLIDGEWAVVFVLRQRALYVSEYSYILNPGPM